jgi:hypothetical protein
MKRFSRILVTAAASLALTAGVSLVAATPAHAYPVGCHIQQYLSGYGGFAVSACSGGSGSHRVKIDCKPDYASTVVRYGPWRGTSETSGMTCKSWERIMYATFQLQGD